LAADPGVALGRNGTNSYTLTIQNTRVWVISPPSLRSDHALAWLLCTGENTTTCEERYDYLETGSAFGHIDTLTDYAATTHIHGYDTTETTEGSEPTTYCQSHTDNTSTATGDSYSAVPGIPGFIGDDDFSGSEDDGLPLSGCVRAGNVITEVLANSANTVSETSGLYSYSGHAQKLVTRTWTYSMPVTYGELSAFVADRLIDPAIPWFYRTNVVMQAVWKKQWPLYPVPELDSTSESEPPPPPDPCERPNCYPAVIFATAFQYRFKLNKCCAWRAIRSEWDEVFFPKAYLDWLAETALLSDESDWPENPGGVIVTPKAWVWSGVPPRCDGSSDSPDSSEDNPFDYEPMWSPWSALVKTAAGQEGWIELRNYQQKCYEAPPQQMPDVFGVYELADESAGSV
jgi:hypothetical protein